MTFKLIISGDSDFTNYDLLKKNVFKLLNSKTKSKNIEIVSDVTEGAAMLGQRFSAEFGYEVAEFPKKNMESDHLLYLFNMLMAGYADSCICFWNGEPGKTERMIDLYDSLGLDLTVIVY